MAGLAGTSAARNKLFVVALRGNAAGAVPYFINRTADSGLLVRTVASGRVKNRAVRTCSFANAGIPFLVERTAIAGPAGMIGGIASATSDKLARIARTLV